MGRFITPDSVVQNPYDPQTLNRYSYCLNNPINRIDPTRHWSWGKFWKSFAGVFVGAAITILTAGAGTPLEKHDRVQKSIRVRMSCERSGATNGKDETRILH